MLPATLAAEQSGTTPATATPIDEPARPTEHRLVLWTLRVIVLLAAVGLLWQLLRWQNHTRRRTAALRAPPAEALDAEAVREKIDPGLFRSPDFSGSATTEREEERNS